MMKRWMWVAAICLAAPMAARAQGSAANPVSDKLRQVLGEYSKSLVASAEEMPADKYSYHPTPEQMTFGKSMEHVAEVNNFACSKISGAPAPQGSKATETDSKDKLVQGLKASMEFCKQAFAKLTDANLTDSVPWFGGRQTTRFAAAIEVTNDLIDHYGALAVYLRLSGLLPPTAQPRK
jgi:uncharacterized damage-inducible protein DinB